MLVLDGAGWHVSPEITEHLPLGLHLEFMPAYSPELYAKRYAKALALKD